MHEQNPNIYTYWDNLQSLSALRWITHIHGHLLQEEGYYPFGLEMKAISSTAAMKPQTRYKFNAGTALEESFDVDYYETFFREYDAQIGRFMGVDALSEKTIAQSPYQFAINNPISFNDPFGLEKEAPKIDWSFYWYYLFTKSANESGMYGGSWTFNSSGQGDGSFIWLQTNVYSSEGGAVYDNLSNAINYWNNQGWNTEGMLNYLSNKGYINEHYGYNSKGLWGMFVSSNYSTTIHQEADNTRWIEGNYTTGLFVKTGDPFSNKGSIFTLENIEIATKFIGIFGDYGEIASDLAHFSKVAKGLGYVGTAAGVGEIIIDSYKYKHNKISGARATYEITGTALATGAPYAYTYLEGSVADVAIGAETGAEGGPWGAILGASIGLTFYVGESFYDYVAKPVCDNFMSNYMSAESTLESGNIGW